MSEIYLFSACKLGWKVNLFYFYVELIAFRIKILNWHSFILIVKDSCLFNSKLNISITVNIAIILRTSFFIEHLWWLLLNSNLILATKIVAKTKRSFFYILKSAMQTKQNIFSYSVNINKNLKKTDEKKCCFVRITESHILIKHRPLCRKNVQPKVSFACVICHTYKQFYVCVGTGMCDRMPLLKGPDEWKKKILKFQGNAKYFRSFRFFVNFLPIF